MANSEADSEDGITHSRWWYGVVVPATLILIGSVSVRIGFAVGLFGENGSAFAVLFSLLTLLTGLLLTPIFALCLFLDTRKIRSANVPWNPNPYLWGGAGLATLVGLALGTFSLPVPLALIYLYRRNQHIGLQSDLSIVKTEPF